MKLFKVRTTASKSEVEEALFNHLEFPHQYETTVDPYVEPQKVWQKGLDAGLFVGFGAGILISSAVYFMLHFIG